MQRALRTGAVDVGYPETGGALAALVVGADETFAAIVEERTVRLATVAGYRPGAFFERELPALREVLAGVTLDLLVVDVQLDPDGRPGLGAYAAGAVGVPVIGVAKTLFQGATHAIPVLRGGSARPLFVTATGIDPQAAADIVRRMAGPHRIPDALKRVDRLSRGGATAAGS
jgi:deoxyribonuclease V